MNKCDKFTIEYLNTLKDKFEDKQTYLGLAIRLEIEGMIKRIE